MVARPWLSKSKYLAGRQCHKRVWLVCRAPELGAEPDEAQQAIFDMGSEVGGRAHALFPGGVLVDEPAFEHRQACERTARLLTDASVPAIFEAAFEHARVRIRVDVLERLPGDGWGLREVKAATSVKHHYLEDVAVQRFVLEGCGLRVDSAELIHVDREYVRGEGPIDWGRFFERVEITPQVDAILGDVPGLVRELDRVVRERRPPRIEPSPHCFDPYGCQFWEHCTRDKPADWVWHLPRLGSARFAELRAAGIECISEIPGDFPLSELQVRVCEVLRRGEPHMGAELAEALGDGGPPAFYLDFETMNPALPLYAGTHPYDIIPFQWSLHHVDRRGVQSHAEFLADGRSDPRRAFAESLIEALRDGKAPIHVYSSFEARILNALAELLPELAAPLRAVCDRLVDLLRIVRAHVYHAGFEGSFSLKRVAPALVPGFGFDDLAGISEGASASAALTRIAKGGIAPDEERALCEQLRAYCQRDTLALVELHRVLLRAAKAA